MTTTVFFYTRKTCCINSNTHIMNPKFNNLFDLSKLCITSNNCEFYCKKVFVDNMILAAGSRHKRFVVNTVRKLKEDCYISTLRILDVEQADSTVYQLRLTNSHGTDMHEIRLVVRGKYECFLFLRS